MKLISFLADIAPAVSPTQVGNAVNMMFYLAGGAVICIGLITYFATNRDVRRLEARVDKMESTFEKLRDEIRAQKDELLKNGDQRTQNIQNRLDPIIVNVAALKGSSEALLATIKLIADDKGKKA